ncbi:PQQ-dependent sugar dehydrogenase [Novosphingobium sp. P6W]|uniref:PQQ-dependent sugar dehydrogenase n=1 Tax=Novosphingobium sp. P6W TaxID=1609758 RepID=UPI0005C3055B|nr:PQQ-dependent sugar dehydrogenase [Novosphingobium sp. P6W]AXB79052.1 glucose dehydrogenase [Novosphingobium sp. P6W]KIS30698.1 glucose dehydrogenase [Novosphingobium sp. P6W]
MTLRFVPHISTIGAILGIAACGQAPQKRESAVAEQCDTAGLALPPGFCTTIFADKIGHVRHIVAGADGTLYANSAPDPEDEAVASGLIVLQDADGDGKAERFQRPFAGQIGGTGLAVFRNRVFLESGDRIVSYDLDSTKHDIGDTEQVVVSGLPTEGDHFSHSIAIRADGSLFVTSGSATNACQAENRKAGAPGQTPCAEKALRAGIWRFDAGKTGQRFSPAARFASGIRNAVGIALDSGGQLFATQHGRDQLHENWGALYSAKQGQELPAEVLLQVKQGDDFGWPECYYDPGQHRLVLAPEYGGDGGKAVSLCASRTGPVAAFPAHWGPNALAVYEGSQFPSAYRGGMFIAFHGSWNRAPGPQQGFNVVFQPMRGGKAISDYVVFADGFAGPDKASGKADFRPSGLAVGPDGALYVGDDKQGRIWRITYKGDRAAAVSGARAAEMAKAPAAPSVAAPGGDAKVALGRRLYVGEIASASCSGCHGADGEGTPVAPSLVDAEWLWSKGDLAGIRRSIKDGVPNPKRFPAPMPPMGGVAISDAQIDAIAAYVASISRPAVN